MVNEWMVQVVLPLPDALNQTPTPTNYVIFEEPISVALEHNRLPNYKALLSSWSVPWNITVDPSEFQVYKNVVDEDQNHTTTTTTLLQLFTDLEFDLNWPEIIHPTTVNNVLKFHKNWLWWAV